MSKKAILPKNIILKAGPPVYGGYTLGRIPQDLAPGFEAPAVDIPSKVIFIKGTIPGEIVEVSIKEEKKDYFVGRVDRIVEPSPFRVRPKFGRCTGCHLEYISYERQVTLKEEVLTDSLRRIGAIETELSPPLTSQNNEWYYRYRAQFKVSQGKIGFHKERTNEVIEIESSPLLFPEINNALSQARLAMSRNPRQFKHVTDIWISYGDGIFAFIKANSKAGGPKKHFDELARLLLGYEFKGVLIEAVLTDGAGAGPRPAKTVLKYGEEFLVLKLDGVIYTVSPNAFFQANWKVNRQLVGLIKNELGQAKETSEYGGLAGKKILDLFSGAGNFSLPLAANAAEVVAVEENRVAIEDGTRNLEINKIKNMRFVRSPVEDFDISSQVMAPTPAENKRESAIVRPFDIVLLDPPRGGLTDKLVGNLLKARPERIVYISCNPSTFARDLKKLTAAYRLESVRLVDFFPQTYHIEAVAFLRA